MGIVQHHDAVSGTERQDVADDYALRLSDGIAAAQVTIFQEIHSLRYDLYYHIRMLLLNLMQNFYLNQVNRLQ